MIRAGQMILLQSLQMCLQRQQQQQQQQQHQQYHQQQYHHHRRGQQLSSKQLEVLSWFVDQPGVRCVYSIHNILQVVTLVAVAFVSFVVVAVVVHRITCCSNSNMNFHVKTI